MLKPQMLIDYELLKQRAEGKPVTNADLAKAALWHFVDPTGLYRAAGNALAAWLDRVELADDDAKNLHDILMAGKAAGVEEMEIEIDKKRVAGLDAELVDPRSGIKVTIEAGASAKAKYKIKVKYKPDPPGSAA